MQAFDYRRQVPLHVVDLLALQFHDDFFLVAFGHLVGNFAEDFAIDVFRYLCFVVASLLQAIKERRVVATKADNELEPALREEVAGVELEDAATRLHEGLELVADHVLVEFGHIEFLVPVLVELLLTDHLSEADVVEALDVVLRQLGLKLLAKGSLTDSRCARNEDVG